MKKKFNVITILALLGLIVASSITLGKVFAYFGSKSSASGAIEMGTLSIGGVTKGDGASIDWDIPNLQPNQSFGGSYKVEVNSNINYYIRILFKASVTPQSGSTHINGTGCEDYVTDDTDILSISIDGNYSKSNIKTADGYTPYYRLTPTKVTSATTTETFNIDLKINDWVGCNYCHYYMKAGVSVNMRVQVMQADYLESNNEGGTVSTVDEMHKLWAKGGLETIIEDVEEYPDLTFIVLSASDKTMAVRASNKSITTANIPAQVKKDGEIYTVTEIEYSSFYHPLSFSYCINLTSVTIPDTVTRIGINAFYSCSNLQYNIYDNGKYLGNSTNPYMVLIGATSTSITSCTINPNCKVIYGQAFYNCSSLTSITIPSTITSIGSYAFLGCSNLQYNIYDNGKYLGNSTNPYVALIDTTSESITSCTINPNCKVIYGQAFYNCSSLTSIVIPTSVTDIGEYAFATKGGEAKSSATITYAGTVHEMTSIHQTGEFTNSSTCYTITCSDGEYKVYQCYDPCLWIETEIDCWDDKKKRRYKKKLKDLTYDDDIVVWDFDNGKFTTAKAMYITRPQIAKAYTLLTFSDGTTLKTIGSNEIERHRIFNVDTQKFEYSGKGMKVGTRVFNSNGEIVTVTDIKFVEEKIEYMNIATKYHFNAFANGILTSMRSHSMYEIKDMKYIKTERPAFENIFGIDEETWNEMRIGEQDVRVIGKNFELIDKFNEWRRMSKPRD